MTASESVGSAPLTEVLNLLSERTVLSRFDNQTIAYRNKAGAFAIGCAPDDYLGRDGTPWISSEGKGRR